VIQRLVRAGSRPISDQYQQQATVASAQYSLVSAQRDLEVARIALIRTLQLDPQGHYEFVTPAMRDSTRTVRFDLDSLLARALGTRADLRALDTRLAATSQSLRSAASTRLPQLSMSLGYNTAYNSASTLALSDQFSQRRNGSVGVAVSIPLFDRNVTSVAVQQARISADNARLAVQDRKQAVAAEVRQAYLDHSAAVEQLAAAQAQYAAADLAASTQARRYAVGAGTLVEVTAAQTQLVQAASAVISARFTVAFQQSLMSYYVGDLVPETTVLR
jgi:outer membrane protein